MQNPAPVGQCGTEVRIGLQGRERGSGDRNRDEGGDGNEDEDGNGHEDRDGGGSGSRNGDENRKEGGVERVPGNL